MIEKGSFSIEFSCGCQIDIWIDIDKEGRASIDDFQVHACDEHMYSEIIEKIVYQKEVDIDEIIGKYVGWDYSSIVNAMIDDLVYVNEPITVLDD